MGYVNRSNGPTRRLVLKSGAAAAAMMALDRAAPRAVAQAGVDRRPNIILLVTDDQRSDSLGCAGNTVIKTPSIDALANNGVRFANNFTTTAICMSSRASILTGLYLTTHGENDFDRPLPSDLFGRSYPMMLRKAGYYTGFTGKWGVGPVPTTGYDFFKGFPGQGAYYVPGNPKHLTTIQADQAIEFLRSCPQHRPFCLGVSFKAPHVQDEGRTEPGIYPKYPYDLALGHLYEKDVIPPVKTHDATPQPEFLKASLNGTREAPDFSPVTYQETMKDLYRLLSGVDDAVGRIVAELKTLGMKDNTVIIYTSDHGSFYGEHGFGGKWLMNEESIRTPMIIFDPRAPLPQRGKVFDQMSLNIDVPATVLDLAGISAPVGMQGKSLLPIARGERPTWRNEWFYEHHFTGNPVVIAASEGVRTTDWKYIRHIDVKPVYEQLFDLKNDPREEKNLAGDASQADRLAEMRNRWRMWRDALDRHTVDQPWVDPA
jgi:arylsulfatase A-like enzyme